LIETNRVGKNATPRYIPARSVKIITDPERGIVGYQITWSNGVKQYPPDQIVYFVLENDDSEIEPDIPPAVVALEAAGLLYASNAAPARFYAGGFVPVSLVTVPLTTQKSDVEKIESFFKRMATGIKKMFSVLGVYEGVDVKQVGHTLKDSITPEITESARMDVAVALGIPPTVLDSTSANYATATSEMIGFYVNTVFPECSLIESFMNAQFFSQYGLRFVFDFELHEIMQSIQLAQASSVVTLTGEPPLTIDEGRAMLGYEETEETEMTPEQEPEDEGEELVKALLIEMRQSRLALEKANGNGAHG
jgi:HK97 family phage portal protein